MAIKTKTGKEITIEHVPTGLMFVFPNTGLRVFNESYSSDWNEEQVFGKMDPIMSFKGTRRNISIEFITSDSGGVQSAEQLATFLYPTYGKTNNALSLKDPPLIRVLFKGFVQATDGLGQLCAVTNYSIDRGTSYNDKTTTEKSGELEATQIVVQMDLVPLHEYDIGWIEEDGSYNFGGKAAQGTYYFSNRKIGK